jgi:hypothetical protein
MAKGGKVNANRGSVLWTLNHFRTDGLSRLLDDLIDLEKDGLAPEQCDQVRRALEKIASKAAAIPDGSFWRGTIYKEFEGFSEVYVQWNSHAGSSPEVITRRREELKRLRSCRHRIAKRVRVNQYILQNELDLMLVDAMYMSLKDITLALPEIFTHLAEAITRYESRKLSTART